MQKAPNGTCGWKEVDVTFRGDFPPEGPRGRRQLRCISPKFLGYDAAAKVLTVERFDQAAPGQRGNVQVPLRLVEEAYLFANLDGAGLSYCEYTVRRRGDPGFDVAAIAALVAFGLLPGESDGTVPIAQGDLDIECVETLSTNETGADTRLRSYAPQIAVNETGVTLRGSAGNPTGGPRPDGTAAFADLRLLTIEARSKSKPERLVEIDSGGGNRGAIADDARALLRAIRLL